MIFKINIYYYKNNYLIMKKRSKKEKIIVSLSIDRKLDDYMNEIFENKSRYIEWLVEQDLLKNGINLEKIIL